jgi:polyisoprenoid-binding protein YceI
MTSLPPLGRYEIDTENSGIWFTVRHLFGLGLARGTFDIRNGTVDVAEPHTDSSLRVEIDTASFHTGNVQRDANVRSARFLDAARHPVMTFTSGPADPGTLTVAGIARPVDLAVERCEVTRDAFTVRATARVDRTAFGVRAMPGLAGRHLAISIEVRCVPARLMDRAEDRARARR